jgi:hypothetical protein
LTRTPACRTPGATIVSSDDLKVGSLFKIDLIRFYNQPDTQTRHSDHAPIPERPVALIFAKELDPPRSGRDMLEDAT